ncbi:hypothetical protein [Endozoicomonas atrinae]|uniref:hypothetical protein n=1 Tax=Endozoicomonas atrinae TaxID=1333660 RepID=UPI003B001531
MLRRTRFSLSISEPRPKPTKKEWIYQWSLIPEDFSTEDTDDADEYIQEWNFPYPGQKEFLLVDPAGLVKASVPLMQKKRLQREKLTYLRRSSTQLQMPEPTLLVSFKK